ncbi:MAG: hypothetical protein ABSB58_03885 [Gemmatimonadales bacterium]|jgi:hypothetical protein
MRISWRLPLLLSACVLAGQLFHLAPLADPLTGTAPADVHLAYPAAHVLLAPFTLLADWLNGSPTRELKGLLVWALAAYALVRLARRRPRGRGLARGVLREALACTLFLAALALFAAWGTFVPRPIPRLVADAPDLLVFDLHSHTAASHDGRPGFGPAENAAWHARAGFDAAFITDHNTTAALRAWFTEAPPGAFRLLPGIELSLSGLHLLALGAAREIPVAPFRDRWDSTGALIRALAAGDTAPPLSSARGAVLPPAAAVAPFLVASLPEYWEHHWGTDLDTLAAWGVRGVEVWTTSPRAMGFPPALRREVAAWCRLQGLAMFAATDMHGLGYTASAWNVTRIRGWRRLEAGPLAAVLVAKFAREGADASQPVVLRRWLPETRAEATVAVPLNLVLLLREASPAHGAALLGWIWAGALLFSFRRRSPRP